MAEKAEVPQPKPLEHKIPDGAMDPKDVKPGYGPLQGSPNPSNPNQLFNPNDPNSYVTKPANASNPANPPATQSDKPASEVALQAPVVPQDNPPVNPPTTSKKSF